MSYLTQKPKEKSIMSLWQPMNLEIAKFNIKKSVNTFEDKIDLVKFEDKNKAFHTIKILF